VFARGLLNAPSKFSVKTEQYPLARRLFLYSIGTPSESAARDILQFALSDAAQATVTEAEFIDQSVEFQDSNEQRLWVQALASDPSVGLEAGNLIPPATVSIFNSTMQRMNRPTIVFRFEYGKSDLDAKVVQDIARLGRYLQSPKLVGKRFLIVGFAVSTGSWSSNADLSAQRAQRAQRVATELQKLGVTVPRGSTRRMSYITWHQSPATTRRSVRPGTGASRSGSPGKRGQE
jgi:phosphate transport system substrate-binding protein